jgi:hypothetical protein
MISGAAAGPARMQSADAGDAGTPTKAVAPGAAQMQPALMERMLKGEMTHHLGYPVGEEAPEETKPTNSSISDVYGSVRNYRGVA